MDNSGEGDSFPKIGETSFNPRLAVAWIEQEAPDSQASYAHDLFDGLLKNASKPKQSSGNGCAKLCGFVENCSKSRSPALREFAFSERSALLLFDFFIEWNEQDQHRSMRLVLDFLKTSILSNPSPKVGSSIKMRILRDIISMITLKSTRPSVKSAMIALDLFLQKSLVHLPDILQMYRVVHDIPLDHSVGWDEFIDKIFGWMEFQYVCPVAGKLLVTVFTCPWYDNQDQRFLPDSWHKFLSNGLRVNMELLEPVKLYVFVPLFKSDKRQALKYLDDLYALQSLTVTDNIDLDIDSMLWLAALEAGKKVGIVGEPNTALGSERNEVRLAFLQTDVLEELLGHASYGARTSAVTILISSASTAKPYSAECLSLFRRYLPIYHADTDAKFRYDVLGHSRNMVKRLLGAISALRRDIDRVTKKADKLLVSDLPRTDAAPGQNPDIKAFALATDLALALHDHEAFVRWYLDFLKKEMVSTASYQRHIMALKAMVFVMSSGLLQARQTEIKGSAEAFCLTDAAWLRSVLDLIMDPFDDVREAATTLMISLVLATKEPNPSITQVQGLSRPLSQELNDFCVRASVLASKTSRADHSDGVARSYEILCHATISSSEKLLIPGRILTDLETKLVAAETDLALAVLESPVHGSFAALRYIWGAFSGTKYSEQELQTLAALQKRAIQCCKRIWATVRHVLCDDSPEGFLPEELEDLDGLDTKDLLSYSFRAIHESSQLLRVVASNARLHRPEFLKPTRSDIDEIGSLTFDELSHLRHRGALTTVAQTFANCCQLVKCFPQREEANLLERWYQGTLNCIFTEATTTRRSAGIPALMVGILSANADHLSLEEVIRKLRSIAEQPASIAETDGSDLPQVHAMNCIKDIFKSSLLSSRAEPFLTDCLQLATRSLKSEVWAIRNCGLLLLRSLIDRLFGTNESKTAMEAGWDGRTTRIAWHKYKTLPEALVSLLRAGQQTAKASIGATAAESVFPALDIIRRAGPPEQFRDQLYESVTWYLESHIWHVREIAARTLCSFLLVPDWIDAIQELLKESRRSANGLHGSLLTFKYLLERLLDVSPEHLLRHYPLGLFDILQEISSTSGSFQTCLEVRAVFYEIVRFVDGLQDSPAFGRASQGGTDFGKLINSVSITERSSALSQSKQAQAKCGIELRGLASEQKEALDLQAELNGDVNVASDTLETVLAYAVGNAASTKAASQLLAICLEMCSSTRVPKPRALAVEILSHQLETLLSLDPQRKGMIPSAGALSSLWKDLQEGPLNPRLADAIVRASGPILAAIAIQTDEEFEPQARDWIRSWGVMMADAGLADRGFDTRYSAITAIKAFTTYISLSSNPATHHIPWLTALYDALNDDDDEIRDVAASAAAHILGKSLISMEAGSRLLAWLSAHFGATEEFQSLVACRMVGFYSVQPDMRRTTPAEEQLVQAMKFDDSLFVIEEQNLFIDEVREAQRWSTTFSILPYPEDSAALRDLTEWTTAGLQTMTRIAEENDDGVLGWTSKPQVFAICSRILISGVALAKGNPGMEDEVRRFYNAGQTSRVHGLLLEMCGIA